MITTPVTLASDQGRYPRAIYADPDAVMANTPYEQVLEINTFLGRPENKVRVQLPSPETQYGWQHMSKYGPHRTNQEETMARAIVCALD